MHITKAATTIAALSAAAVGAVGVGAPAAAQDLTGLSGLTEATPTTVLENLPGLGSLGGGNGYREGALISVGSGSAINAVPIQLCGSDVIAGIGSHTSFFSQRQVDGGCRNAEIDLGRKHHHGHGGPHWCDVCAQIESGAQTLPGLAPEAVPQSPLAAVTEALPLGPATTVLGGYGHHGGGFSGGSLISVGSGSAINAVPIQLCGSDVIAGIGASHSAYTHNQVDGGCRNAEIDLEGGRGGHHGGSLISVLDGSAVNLLPVQLCGSRLGLGLGLLDEFGTSNTVRGGCRNAEIRLERG